MKGLLLVLLLLFCGVVQAQDCPAGKVCLDQSTFNTMVNKLEQLVEAKDVIEKLLRERGTSDAVIASALKTIEGWQSLNAINEKIIVKYEQVIALYEKVIAVYDSVVTNLEKQLNKPRSALQKFLSALKQIVTFLGGVAIGRGLGL